MGVLTTEDKRMMAITAFVAGIIVAVILGIACIAVFVGGCRDYEGFERRPSPMDAYFECVDNCTHGYRSDWGQDEVRRCLTACEIHTLPRDATTATQED